MASLRYIGIIFLMVSSLLSREMRALRGEVPFFETFRGSKLSINLQEHYFAAVLESTPTNSETQNLSGVLTFSSSTSSKDAKEFTIHPAWSVMMRFLVEYSFQPTDDLIWTLITSEDSGIQQSNVWKEFGTTYNYRLQDDKFMRLRVLGERLA